MGPARHRSIRGFARVQLRPSPRWRVGFSEPKLARSRPVGRRQFHDRVRRGRDGPLAELLGQCDDDALGTADVAEPIAVLVLRHLAIEVRAACSQAGDVVRGMVGPSGSLGRFGRRLLPGLVAGRLADRVLLAGLLAERGLSGKVDRVGPRRDRRRRVEPSGTPLRPGVRGHPALDPRRKRARRGERTHGAD